MNGKSIFDAAFGRYGWVLTGMDTAELCGLLRQYDDPAGVTYLASQPQLEALDIAACLQNEVFGQMPVQVGVCYGVNSRMDAMEYHKCSEINIAAEDQLLFLGCRQDITDRQTYDTGRAELFFVPAGTMYEMYATTLHYAPCGVAGRPFRCAIVLPRETNTALEGVPTDPLLTAKNKWLIGHPAAGLPQGTWLGLVGENRTAAEWEA